MASGPLWVIYVADPTLTDPQVAFAIGRTAGSAVRRNRVRSQLRSYLADLDRQGRVAPGLYLVGVPGGAGPVTGPDLRGGLDKALRRLTESRS